MRALITGLGTGLGLLGIAGCTSLAPADDPMYLRVTDMEARLIRIERVLENESIIQLAGQIDALRNETQLLRGEIETLQFGMDNATERQLTLYNDVDARLQDLEANQSQTVERLSETVRQVEQTQQQVADVTAPPIPIGSDQDNYNAGFDLIQSRQYGDAAVAFQSFLRTFPDSPLADNAQYWLAETFYVQRQFADALPQFQRVLDDFPQSAKLPVALLKIGYTHYELKQWDLARAALTQVQEQYPDTTLARLAGSRLRSMKLEGHF